MECADFISRGAELSQLRESEIIGRIAQRDTKEEGSSNDILVIFGVKRSCVRTKGLFILPDPRISEVQLKKSNLSKVVFLEAKDGTRSHVKGFGIYSYISGFKVGPKLA